MEAHREGAWYAVPIYWAVGLLLAQLCGVGGWRELSPRWELLAQPTTLLAAAMTAVNSLAYHIRVTPLPVRHSVHMPFATAFGICNGYFEALWYMLAFQAGVYPVRHWTLLPAKCSMEFVLGFFVFSTFGGLIHSRFWRARVWPYHPVRNSFADKAFFITLLPMTWYWMQAYYMQDHAFVVILLCTLASFSHAISLTMQPPAWTCCVFGPSESKDIKLNDVLEMN